MRERLKRLWPYVARYRGRYLIGAVCVVLSVALRYLVPYLLGSSIDELRGAAEGGAAARPESELKNLLVWSSIGMVAAAVIGAVVRTASRLMILGNSRRAVHDVRRDLFDKLLRLEPAFYVRHRTGHIMSRCVNDMQNVQGLLGPVFMYLVETGVLYAVGLAFMLSADPRLALIGLAPFPLFLWLARRLAQQVQEGSRSAQEKLGDITAKVDESLSGHRVIRTLGIEDHDRATFVGRCEEYSATQIKVARVRSTLAASMTFLAALSTFGVLAFGAGDVSAGRVSVGEIVSLILYLGMLAVPTRTLGFVLSSLQRGAAALQRIGEIFDMPEPIRDVESGEGATAASVGSGALAVRGLRVDFAAPDDLPHLSGSLPEERVSGRVGVLDGIDIDVPAGKTLGVVGPIGSGKSTLLSALARQIDIAPGMVSIDGVDLTEMPLVDLRRTVGTAPQDAFLFSETLLENVRFGRPEASDEEVMAAIGVAGMDRDLAQLPKGVATMLGERGVNLSGGQRQRTSLARVVLTAPQVLLLDDTLSAVDTDTADAILAGLRPLMQERTTVIVAHRLSTVRDADQIIVLDEGRIIERGTHEELLKMGGGYYAEVWQRQSTTKDAGEQLGASA